ncbi:hypothetical protein ABDK96_15635 [Citricoccus nitrophenolicus]|uniref:DUF4175 domain-containing protein n=1 Tax=Citricoccus nitrophenolicus TaxID=863575 RepID=A0ABV0ILS2_9MICC
MIWLYIAGLAAAAAMLVAFATRPVSFTLGLIQTISFLALAFGVFGWFTILPDPVFLWYIGVGGAIWLLTTVLRWAA